MGDKSRGIYDKFRIERTDGKHRPGEKHDGCEYFVLDLTHDRYAVYALISYAAACKGEYPLLSDDLKRKVRELRQKEAEQRVAANKRQCGDLPTIDPEQFM